MQNEWARLVGLRPVSDETMKDDEAMKGFVGLSHCGSPTGETEIPFGLSSPRFFVLAVCFDNACCFR